ncbi:MAG: M28 family peptidase [Nitrospirae bacterium]|nr:M28 family peptidase [Nitrospirota bacterium]MCL5422207.1 M28 family peptidase [Nitrospirota bacterium]
MPNSESKRSRWKKLLLIAALLITALLCVGYWYMIDCEGKWRGEPLEKQKGLDLSRIKNEMEEDVAYMQGLGPRNSMSEANYKQLRLCEEWIVRKWESQGYTVRGHSFTVNGRDYANLEIEFHGKTSPSEIIIVSAQYDTLPDSPGANNDGSGMAVLFQLSGLLKNFTGDRTLRLVAFVNEEDPFFGTEKMGSYQYAMRSYHKGEDIRFMLSLDSLGIYKDEPGTQRLPFPFSLFYPDRGNFLAFIGNLSSRKYMIETTRGFKKGSSFPIRAGVVPEWVKGAPWSDHQSFWKFGYPGIQVTDTGGFRSPYHTTREDTMEKLNFDAMSRIAIGMYTAVDELAGKRK